MAHSALPLPNASALLKCHWVSVCQQAVGLSTCTPPSHAHCQPHLPRHPRLVPRGHDGPVVVERLPRAPVQIPGPDCDFSQAGPPGPQWQGE